MSGARGKRYVENNEISAKSNYPCPLILYADCTWPLELALVNHGALVRTSMIVAEVLLRHQKSQKPQHTCPRPMCQVSHERRLLVLTTGKTAGMSWALRGLSLVGIHYEPKTTKPSLCSLIRHGPHGTVARIRIEPSIIDRQLL